jgi:drug/metabolite transporter (DMT)-like permease
LGLPEAWIEGIWDGTGELQLQQLLAGGQWLMLLAALSMAVGTVMMRGLCRHVDPVVATGWHMILGGLPLFALSSQLEVEQFTHLSGSAWLSLAYSTIFGSAIAYGLFFYFASRGNLTSLSALTFFTPVFALLFGNLFLSEVLTSWQQFGVGLTLVSIYCVNQRDVLADCWSRAWETVASKVTFVTQSLLNPSYPIEVPVEVLDAETESWSK